MPDAKLFRATIELDVIYEADGPKHAIDFARASLLERALCGMRGDQPDPFLCPHPKEHNSAVGQVVHVEILQRNGEVAIDSAPLSENDA